MKNILILSASPRKNGNSDILCRRFIKGAQDAGHKTELISLYDKNIECCRACYACFQNRKMCYRGRYGRILNKMQQADVIVVATPTYFYTMNGKLKTVIDRFLPKWQELGGHDVYLIITGHDGKAGLRLAGEELKTIFGGLGNEIKGCIWGERVWQKGEVEGTKAMQEAYQAGYRA